MLLWHVQTQTQILEGYFQLSGNEASAVKGPLALGEAILQTRTGHDPRPRPSSNHLRELSSAPRPQARSTASNELKVHARATLRQVEILS